MTTHALVLYRHRRLHRWKGCKPCATMSRMDTTDPSPEPSTHQSASPDHDAHEVREINEVVERLSARFPQEQPDRIRTVVDAAHEQFQGNPIRDFVPVFVERAAKDVLDRPPTDR